MGLSKRIDIRPVIVALVLSSACLAVDALNIPECQTAPDATFINNTRPNCAYSVIYCNGNQSQFCESITSCNSEYTCDDTAVGSTLSTPVTTNSSSTVLPAATTTPLQETAAPLDEFPECASVPDETFINHTRPNCAHSLIYCDGEYSQFCDSPVLCDMEYTCEDAVTTSTTVATTVDPLDVRTHCRWGVTRKYKYPGNCNYFYHCMNGFLVVDECPIGIAYNEETATCNGRITDFEQCRRR